jgi:hypothetical protein
MQAYLLEQPPAATDDIPEHLRTVVWDKEDADWYLSAYMLGLSHDQITAPIVDEATVTVSNGEKGIVLFSTNYLLDYKKALREEQKIELSRFLKMLGNPNQS